MYEKKQEKKSEGHKKEHEDLIRFFLMAKFHPSVLKVNDGHLFEKRQYK